VNSKITKVTIGLPVVKIQFLREAILSCLNQTFSDFDLLIFNFNAIQEIRTQIDQIIKSFNDRRISYFNNIKHTEIINDWNAVLNQSGGEYFVLFSDDDIMERDFLRELINLSEKYPLTDIFHSRVRIIDEDSKLLNYSSSCPEWESVYNYIWHRMNSYRNHYVPEFMCRTSALKKIGGFIEFPLAWCSDDATWYLLAKQNGIGYCDRPLCNWRYSDINISKIGDIRLRFDALLLYDKWLQNFLSELKPVSQFEKELLFMILNMKEKWFENAKTLLLSKETQNQSIIRVLKLLLRWMKYRRYYKISNKSFFKAMLISVKHHL
jgi:glycosyltransferase involved in cell wall biosynthesis